MDGLRKERKLISRVNALLAENDITVGGEELSPIMVGAGGACVYSSDKYVIKYARLSEMDVYARAACRKEFDFYEVFSESNMDFVPEIIIKTADSDEILIVMKKYSPVQLNEWDENLQKRAMELCARVNAVDAADFGKLFRAEGEGGDSSKEDSDTISLSYQDWMNLQRKFPEHIDGGLLGEMYANFNKINAYADKIRIPKTLCHGDFHPNNLLKHGEKLIICDWQGVCMGKGIGDAAFFISRGEDMGIEINRSIVAITNNATEAANAWICNSCF